MISASQSGSDAPLDEVLTLEEAAAYLRVSDAALRKLVTQQAVPGHLFGDEWRFSKAGLADWLRYNPFHSHALKSLSEAWAIGRLPLEELVAIVEQRVLARLPSPEPQPGTKQAVRKAFGLVRGGDPEAEIQEMYARRKEAAVEGEG